MNSSPQKVICYETPRKLYVGNLARTVQPAELKNLSSRFGTVVSVRILHDTKAGKRRIFGFLSFPSEAKRDAAMSLNGMELHGRTLVV
ncbi:hypothetical protein L6164_021293 [Bauhinia variegata]|uniref:Uncharacterized protein n=1 Tax=Bauhinia variegata TaxID=167791 RepID=A0ACB9MZ08_BAUVA|nr:hypothetical protein L6164_021293 [Bauhinia variegata]